MKTALILGATGLIGRGLTNLLLADIRYSKIIVLVRKPMDFIHKNLLQITFDFNSPDNSLLIADEVYCCLGTTINTAGSKAEFYKVDHDYVVKTAAITFSNGIKKYALVSSVGADKNSTVFYNKTKGETEEALSAIGFESLFIFRPSILLGKRNEKRLGEAVAKWLMVKLSFLVPKKYKAIEAVTVARAMIVTMNSGRRGLHLFESDAIASLNTVQQFN